MEAYLEKKRVMTVEDRGGWKYRTCQAAKRRTEPGEVGQRGSSKVFCTGNGEPRNQIESSSKRDHVHGGIWSRKDTLIAGLETQGQKVNLRRRFPEVQGVGIKKKGGGVSVKQDSLRSQTNTMKYNEL